MVNTAREPRAYELMTILVPELAEEDLATQIQRISSHISTATGAIKETLTDSPWGRRRLAYSVRHNSQDYRDGYYIVFHFDLQPSRMTEIERELKLDVNVMRYLLVHDDPKAGEKDTSRPESDDSAVDPAAPSADGGARSAPPAPGSERPAADAPVPGTDAPPAAEAVPAAADPSVEEANAEPTADQTESLSPASSDAAPATDDEPDAPEPVTEAAATGSSDPAEMPASGGDAAEDAADETDTTNDAKQEG